MPDPAVHLIVHRGMGHWPALSSGMKEGEPRAGVVQRKGIIMMLDDEVSYTAPRASPFWEPPTAYKKLTQARAVTVRKLSA